MAAVDQAQAVMENLANKTLTGTVMLSAAKNYINYRDVWAWTNEQIAQKFIDDMFLRAKHQVKSGAFNRANDDNAAVVQAAVDTSIADL